MAEGIVRTLSDRMGLSAILMVDSAGTHAGHAKEAPDPRACQVAKARGVNLAGLVARQVIQEDFAYFDRILAMDKRNLEYLRRNCPKVYASKLGLFLDHAEGVAVNEVPDPYYSSLQGFENVFDLCEKAARGLIKSIAELDACAHDKTAETSQVSSGSLS